MQMRAVLPFASPSLQSCLIRPGVPPLPSIRRLAPRLPRLAGVTRRHRWETAVDFRRDFQLLWLRRGALPGTDRPRVETGRSLRSPGAV
ncbi:hypothetical protein SKAU_G00324060 [Synaphobranchus kaupii]|uniref:Uncharacterized protein n=1 Tax=Synaphobranchus kaupii TaxID=118154 RepID=A0A9Q1IHY0_SYNKA|nr:hypothetical protein SKAU_G00324060 [Synaphobranchus kaupii]